ncbi:hypothetical protein JYU34_000764 [Plutella xylostella]|uniref:Uncharacterized protein n=1 Tax=Plutella xylostella TaxID=51655 RepID=A0ABQ7R8G7_PLUXY|nr:hypothetical protein JYU34_000764 [Plutella xylostella]
MNMNRSRISEGTCCGYICPSRLVLISSPVITPKVLVYTAKQLVRTRKGGKSPDQSNKGSYVQ